ncbi:MAG: MurR/RpiR family transcriptional regulator [Erysipelotrichaceae bacterium]|nr:MurR/RpiR family transcriptional regulator [Erysipelotrichaceae bacterium]
MELIISRILKYLNGCLVDDHMYRIGNFIVKNYKDMGCLSLNDFMSKGHFSEAEVLDFCGHLGYGSFDTFKEQLLMDQQLRLDQIQSRMIMADWNKYLDDLQIKSTKPEFMKMIDELCDLIFENDRIIIEGGLFPTGLAVDFQTDMISFGKEVIDYHHFDNNFKFKEDDIVLFITATGRMMEYDAKDMVKQNLCEAYVVLLTQNIKYINFENVCADYVIHVTGKFDSIDFGYQILRVLDILRIRYYQKYYK